MKVGIALSGGGIRGIAHAGVLKALEENQIRISMIGGTSSGSLVASLYAMGYSPYYIYILFKRYAKEMISVEATPIVHTVSNFMTSKRLEVCGFNSGEVIEKAFNDIAIRKGIKKLTDIKMPIVIPTVDVNNAREYVFTNCVDLKEQSDKTVNKQNGTNQEVYKSEINNYITDVSVGTAVRASSSFPGIFCPCEFEGHRFLDGGILDNIPVNEVRKMGADKVIAVNFKADHIDESSNFMDISMRTIDIMGNKISEEGLQNSDYVLTVQTDKTGLLDIEKLDSCYRYGYRYAIRNMVKIKSSLYNSLQSRL